MSIALALAFLACRKAAQSPPTPWRFWGFVASKTRQAPIVVREDEAALVLESGLVSIPFKVSDGGSTMIALGDESRVVIGEPHAVRALDAKTGRVRWSAPLPNAYGGSVTLAMGQRSVAVVHSNGVELFALDDGRVLYEIENQRASQVLYAGGGFLIALHDELRFVEESGSLRWKSKLVDAENARLRVRPDGRLFVSSAYGFKVIDVGDGDTLGEPTPIECPHPDPDHVTTTIGNSVDGSYVLEESVTRKDKRVSLVACDVLGEQRWRAPFAVPAAPYDPKHIRMDDGRVVGWIVPASSDMRDGPDVGHTLLAFDDVTGKPLPLTIFDRSTHLIGVANSCLLVSKPTAFECVDPRTSKPRWTYARSEHAEAWALGDDEALVFDDENMVLVRTGTKGERWRATLHVGFADDESTTSTNWSFSRDVGVWDASDGRIQVVNLVTGSMRTVEVEGS